MSYIPTDEKLAPLGFGPPAGRNGRHPSLRYTRPNDRRIIVVWPHKAEVRLCIWPRDIVACHFYHTGPVVDEAAFDALLVAHGFMLATP